MSTLQTPLVEAHRKLSAKMTTFGGWEMPVYYSGIIPEHLMVRKSAGIFDVSHMCPIEVMGSAAVTFLQSLCTNNVEKLAPGRVQYNLLCNEGGGVVDDILLYRLVEDKFMVVANATNADKVKEWLKGRAPSGIGIKDLRATHGIISLQGPKSPEIMKRLGWEETTALRKNDIAYIRFRGERILVSRTGYTGSDGFEFLPTDDLLNPLWDTLLAEPCKATPCGLGARDSLRIEAGLPLYGHEYAEDRVPIGTPFEWAIKFNKGDFIGRKTLLERKEQGPKHWLLGWKSDSRSIPRAEQPVYFGNDMQGPAIGWISSGTFSPLLSQAIGFVFIQGKEVPPPETPIHVDVRGRSVHAIIWRVPFVGKTV